MSLSVLFIFALQIFYVPFALPQSETPPCVICGFGGVKGNPDFSLAVADVPESCDAIWYGFYCFDDTFNENDIKAISTLVSAGKKVFLTVIFWTTPHWVQIMDATDPSCYAQYMDPLEKFLNDNKISGIILQETGVFEGKIANYPTKMNTFITNVKAKVPCLEVVGLFLEGYKYGKFGRSDLFNFAITNTAVDLYLIDPTTVGMDCTADTTDRYPITSSKIDVTGLEDICISAAASSMDKDKLVSYVLITTDQMEGNNAIFKSYKDYCSRSPGKELWCGDSIEVMYDRAAYLKKYFKGVFLLTLDFDDYDDTCGCGKYPVANAYIDAWKSAPIKCCDAISGAH